MYIMSSPKFEIGQRVNRKEERDVVGAVILEYLELDNQITYKIQYDEGITEGANDGTGWWFEEYLEAENN